MTPSWNFQVYNEITYKVEIEKIIMKLTNPQMKTCLLLMLGALITSCNNGSETTKSTLNEIASAPVPSRMPAVVISRIATIPVNTGDTGTHAIRVDNHTNHNLRLINAQIDNNTIEDSAAGCNILSQDRACSIPVAPKNSQEATVIRLSYKDETGKIYNAAQLINYSPTVMSRDGFIVSEGEFAEIYSTNDYSLTIPFIADDDYDELDVSSDVMMLDKHLDCSGKITKGTHCTATLTLPAATGAGYGNQITLIGKTSSGQLKQYRFNSRAYFEDRPSLVLSGGPLAVKASNAQGANNSTILRVVNNGVLPVSIFSEEYKALSSEIHGTIAQSNVTSALAKTIANCGFDGKTSTSVGTVAKRGDVCEIRLALNNLQQPQSGHDQYSITYNGEAGPTTTKTTFIYYTGLTTDIDPNRPDGLVNYAYTVSGNLNFLNTAVTNPPRARTEYVQIQNTGKEPIRITNWNVSYPAGMATRTNECANKTLARTEVCRIYVTYTPTTAIAAVNNLLAEIKAVRADNSTTTDFIAPDKKVGILYSATGTPPNVGTLTLSHGRVYLEKEAGVTGSVSEDVIIENSGKADYLIGGINALANPNLSRSLTMSLPATFTLPGSTTVIANPLSTLTINGLNATGQAVRLTPGQKAIIRYSYDSTTAENGTLHQQIQRASSNDTVPIQIDYATIPSPIRITAPTVIGTKNTAGGNLTSGQSFPLTWSNKLTLKAEYEPAGGTSAKSFIVDDSDLPYGFAVKSRETTCPTISKGSTPTTLSSKCEVQYEYLRSDISNINSYTLVTQNAANQTFKTPAYSLEGAGNQRRKVIPSQSFSYQTKPFATITTSQTSSGNNRTVTFRVSSYDAANLTGMSQYPVVIVPDYAANNNITGATSCVIENPAAGKTCAITFTLNSTANKTLPITYASTEDAYYNSIRTSLTLN